VLPLAFEVPERLWWLLLLPVLFWLAMPPRPRAVVWTAHLPQWALAQKALRRRPPRLRGLRFVLLAVACVTAVFAHAGLVQRGVPGPQRLVVLLDASASMAANGSFAAATARMREQFATVPEAVDITVVRCGGPVLRRRGASARALQDLGGPEGAAVADLADLAARLAQPDTAVWTLTDGQGQERLPAAGALSCFGAAGPNGAVLGVRTVDRWPLPQIDLEVDVIAFAPTVVTAELRVSGAVEALPAASIELPPGGITTLQRTVQRAKAGGTLEVQLVVPGDVLASDDRWRFELPPLPAPSIAVLGEAEGGPFAAVAAEALAKEVGGEVVAGVPGTEVGLLLVDGGALPIVPGEVRALCFGSRFSGAAEPTPWLQPAIADWARTGPMGEGLDLSELRVDCAFRETLPAGEPFLWATEPGGPNVPLAVVCGGADLASVHFAFRLQDSNLPLLPAFPQLLRRAFVRTYGAGAALRAVTPVPAVGEQDLSRSAHAPDRPLPAFGTPDRNLAPWLLFAGLVALALRAFVR
jgi:hypothetical protein